MNDYWTYAYIRHGAYPEHTPRGGKWLIFVSVRNLDHVWSKIKRAVEEGKLGGIAKTVQSGGNSGRSKSAATVICVYTYDWMDVQDVKRIRAELRKIGITRKLSYKTDEDTERGIYRATTSEKVSKYYE